MYKKLAFRRLKKNKYIWINILGLSLGVAVFMTLFLFIQHENSFEKTHTNLDNIYRLEQIKKDGNSIRKLCGTPPPLALVIDQDIPGISKSTRMVGQHSAVIATEDGTKNIVDDIIFAEESYTEIFTYPIIQGAVNGQLDQPNMAIVSEEYAKILFGEGNAIGKKIIYDNGIDLEIQSVAHIPSENSHMNFSLLISFETLVSLNGEEIVNEDWNSNWCRNFILLDESIAAENVNQNLSQYLQKYQGEESENTLYLKPLADIHLRSDVVDEFVQVGSYQNNLVYIVIAILIIVIASINYINLTIAYASERIKEIGIRKVIGANKKTVLGQLLGESTISILISTFIALILIELFLPIFNGLVNRSLSVNYMDNWQFITLFVLICIGVGMLTGFIPAKTISGFEPLSMTKKVMLKGRKGLYFRYGLVLFQFFISISLISCTLLLFKQYNFIKNKDLGYKKDNILLLNITNPDKQTFYQFKTELEKLPAVDKVDYSDYLPMRSTNWTMFTWKGAAEDEYIKMNINYVGPEFLEVYDIEIINGTGFEPEMVEREQKYVVLNETAVKEMGWKDDPVGKEIRWQVDYRTRDVKTAKVAGITKDFHHLSKHQAISPLIMPLINQDGTGSTLSIKLSKGQLQSRIESIREVFTGIYPEETFNFQFADEVINNLYQTEHKMGKLVLSLTFLAITIAVMGLIGLITYTANQKTKEIGIRKVNGAGTFHIMKLISMDFAKLLVIGFLISCPLSILVMNIWLRNFAYQTSISWWIFALTFVNIMLISLLSISFQTIKAAVKNPVDALRYE